MNACRRSRCASHLTLGLLIVGLLLQGCSPQEQVRRVRHPVSLVPWLAGQHDFSRTGSSPVEGPSDPYVKWSFDTGASFVSGSVVDRRGTVFVGSNSGVYSISRQGQRLWRLDLENSYVAGSPSLDSSRNVYFAADGGYVYSVTPSGRLRWRRKTNELFGPTAGPVLDSRRNVYVGGEYGMLFAFSPSGKSLWRRLTIPRGGHGGVALRGDRLYFSADSLRCYTLKGRLLWSFRPKRADVASTPVVDSRGFVYAAGDNRMLYALDGSGRLRWSLPVGGSNNQPTIAASGTIYLVGSPAYTEDAPTGGSVLYSISREGKVNWTVPVAGDVSWPPIIDRNETVYVGGQVDVMAVTRGGRILWRLPSHSLPSSSAVDDPEGISALALSGDGDLIFGNGGVLLSVGD